MPFNPVTLGALCVVASGVTDPIGITGWLGIASAFTAWTISNATVNPLGGTPLIAIGPAITGTGAIVPGPTPTLGVLLAAASLTTDAAGFAKWLAVANEYGRWLTTCGIDPSLMVAYSSPLPPTGPVTGTGLVLPVGKPDFATAIGITDAVGRAHWDAVATAVAAQIALSTVSPTFTNPGVGGPVTGIATIS